MYAKICKKYGVIAKNCIGDIPCINSTKKICENMDITYEDYFDDVSENLND